MSDVATTAKEALDKLNAVTGNLQYWMSPAEYNLIQTACGGAIGAAATVTTPGPATTVAFTLLGPYIWPAAKSITVTMAVPALVISHVTKPGQSFAEVCMDLAANLNASGLNCALTNSGSAYGTSVFTMTGASRTITSVVIA